MIGTARVRAVLAAAVTLLMTAGCATVPTGGRVVSGQPADRSEQVDDSYVRLVPVRPRPEWGPAQIVSGFLSASASFDDDQKVAREYVSPSAGWRPGLRPAVAVFQDRDEPVLVKESGAQATVRVEGDQLGTIGPDGQYTADPKHLEVTFQLAKTPQGVWRITELPTEVRGGLLLTKADVERAFRTVNLYYFGPDGRTLVPNAVFLPLANRQDLPTRLVQALLVGPTSWLAPAVRSAFPPGTRLRGGVTISKDVAVVDLTGQARSGSLERMSAQLSWTLRQLSEVKHFKLQIEGETVTPEGVGSVQSVRAWAGNAPDGESSEQGSVPQSAYLIGAAGHLSRLAGDVPQPIVTGTAGRLVHPAVAPDHQEVAGLSPDSGEVLVGTLVAGSTDIRPILTRRDPKARFTAPSFDRNGMLWTVESTKDGSTLWVRPRGRAPVRAAHWGLGGRQVLALRVARDGVRVAAIVKMDRRAQVHIGRIVHRPDGGVEVGSFLPVSSELQDAIDLAWRDYGTLAVLGRAKSDSQPLPYLVPVSGGAISSLGVGALGLPQTIAAAPKSPVLVGTRSSHQRRVCRQRSYRDQFSEWVCAIPGSDPTYAQ
ncbi:UNVERIFIED_ORG: sporulation and spore germination protein [Actinomadura viridilutea]|uniref:LpqB family beta-propeller domain-containing protein n=1 Tax=Actinomadura rubrobrunea TaxID=115335 RepID=UPI000B0BE76B|nr:LpqB family beta-propeller domain-containing protein [Actinomadura rubrobrunea]